MKGVFLPSAATAWALYDTAVLGHPWRTLLVVCLIVLGLVSQAPQFRLDASADTLVLENDHTLAYYRSIRARYGSDDNLVLTYSPSGDLFSDQTLADLQQLSQKLKQIRRVESVISLLDVPLIQSPPVTLNELNQGVLTLASPQVDRSLAREEFLGSPLYRNYIISQDAGTTALLIQFERDPTWHQLRSQRDALRAKQLEQKLNPDEQAALAEIGRAFDAHKASLQAQEASDIASIRQIMLEHSTSTELHLGGVPMITADSIEFVRHDLRLFGIGISVFLMLLLQVIFGRPRWVLLPLLSCAAAGLSMVGLLGWLGWPVTVVSSNFISLLLILTLSLMVHLIVRYRELLGNNPLASQRVLVLGMVKHKFVPCLYTAITTMVAFGSLLVSDIRPVIDFGWMMVFGLVIAMVLAFSFFPAALVLLKVEPARHDSDITSRITGYLAHLNEQHGNRLLLMFTAVSILSAWGLFTLTVENRFIDYYKPSTEIYQGMSLIDNKLGGTTPLDVIIDAPADFIDQAEEEPLFEEFNTGQEAGITGTSYWFNSHTLQDIARIHDYLDGLQHTGKVLSVTTALRMLESIDPNIIHDNFALAVLYKRLPPEIKQMLIEPYLSSDGNQLRFSIRLYESDPSLQRNPLLHQIRRDLKQQFQLTDQQIHLSGMAVLYNNMLQSLFDSQILTIGVVFFAILLMFVVLFRNLRMAAVAIAANLFPALFVLGLMGWMGIPLDMMTITIAAICVGIAVDDTIHYIHRYTEEFRKQPGYWGAARRSHGSIGRAMYYTTLTITLGFSILAFSNFMPTIYFGLLTGLAMLAALLADLTLLPLLIVRFKPFGPEPDTSSYRASDLQTGD